MRASYDGRAGPDYDRLLDTVAATSASNDVEAIARVYRSEDVAVPAPMLT